MKSKCIHCSLIIALVCFSQCGGNSTERTDYAPQWWRGPARDGVYPETGLLKSWPADGPTLLWDTEDVGNGFSSPVIVGDRIYITGLNEDEDMEIFTAYSLDGKKLYQVEYGDIWTGTYPETRTTPSVVNGKAYMVSGSGEIVCIHTDDGSIVWKVNGGEVFEQKTGNWGTSESVLVFDNKVIYTPSGDQTTMVALDAQTGEPVWKTRPLGDIGAYVSPILISYRGKRQIIGSTAVHLTGVNPENGEIEWTFSDWGFPDMPWPNIAPNSPLFSDGRIFFSHGYDIGGYMLQLNDDLSDVSLLWKTDDLDTHHGGYVLVEGTIYGSNWTDNSQGNWVAVDWNTGETRYEETWSGGKSKGSIITADGMLYCYDERRGTVGLVRPNPDKFDVVSEFRITKGGGPHWAHPVIHNGVLYIRHGSALMAYHVKQ